MKGRVLIVDDEKNMALVISAMLERAGFEVLSYTDPKEASEAIANEDLDAVVTDLQMPGIGGMEILATARRYQPQVPVVMITAFATVEKAVSALKNGAFDFITKPFDQTELLAVIEKACGTRRERLQEPESSNAGPDFEIPFTGDSLGAVSLRSAIEKAAIGDSSLMIVGERGTGKEGFAREVHRRSSRAAKPLIVVNCAVVPEGDLLGELFGTDRVDSGSGAAKPSRFELADGGVLFLDGIADIPLALQSEVLSKLEAFAANSAGSNVRILAAAHRDLPDGFEARLGGTKVTLPSLRERRDDIEPLVRRIIASFNGRLGKNVSRASPEVLAAFQGYAWPGNIRQLETVIERMMLQSESDLLGTTDLPDEIAHTPADADSALGFKELVRRQTQATERDLIEKALTATNGNVTHTAERLGLSRKGLQLKMKELGIRRS